MRERVRLYEAGHIRTRAQRSAAAEHTYSYTVAHPRLIVSRVYC